MPRQLWRLPPRTQADRHWQSLCRCRSTVPHQAPTGETHDARHPAHHWHAPAAVKPVVKDDLLEMLLVLGQQKPVKAARDHALLLIGWGSAMRRSELVALRCEDITEHATGLELLIVRSKTDQEGGGPNLLHSARQRRTLPGEGPEAMAGVDRHSHRLLFRSVDRHDNVSDKPLSAQSVALIVKDAVRRVGGDPSAVSGHSLRAGYCTQAAIAGLQPWQIRDQTGHTSDLMLARYIRPVAKRKLPSLL